MKSKEQIEIKVKELKEELKEHTGLFPIDHGDNYPDEIEIERLQGIVMRINQINSDLLTLQWVLK